MVVLGNFEELTLGGLIVCLGKLVGRIEIRLSLVGAFQSVMSFVGIVSDSVFVCALLP